MNEPVLAITSLAQIPLFSLILCGADCFGELLVPDFLLKQRAFLSDAFCILSLRFSFQLSLMMIVALLYLYSATCVGL